MSQSHFRFTLWDVGHGLNIWVQTPNGQQHVLDCGANENFSPAEHAKDNLGIDAVDFLIISHPDNDHLFDLPMLIEKFKKPRVLLRNKTLPDEEKFKSGNFGYQTAFKSLDSSFTAAIPYESSPLNPNYNGGIEIKTGHNSYSDQIKGNNTSVVAMYLYADWLFVCPGDIEDLGWRTLWESKKAEWEPFINKSKWRVLVAPHHGRESGYSQSLMDAINPGLVIISDEAGPSGTDRRFREKPTGLKLIVAPETDLKTYRFLSTKRSGRIQFSVDSNGYKLHQYEYEYWK